MGIYAGNQFYIFEKKTLYNYDDFLLSSIK